MGRLHSPPRTVFLVCKVLSSIFLAWFIENTRLSKRKQSGNVTGGTYLTVTKWICVGLSWSGVRLRPVEIGGRGRKGTTTTLYFYVNEPSSCMLDFHVPCLHCDPFGHCYPLSSIPYLRGKVRLT